MLDVQNLNVALGKFKLSEISFQLEKATSFVILGPSGSGKTTLLKSILGLVKVNSGKIVYEGKDITYLPPEKRCIAYVPQKLALYPHMTAYENIRYPLKIQKLPKEEQKRRIKDVLEFMEMWEKRDVYPHQLSGGEAQRVSIARALTLDWPLILMDEPLIGIDAPKAKKIRKQIREAIKKYDKTVMYVTHHLGEAAELGMRIAIMNNGRIERISTPTKLTNDPKSRFVAELLNLENIFTVEFRKEKNACYGIITKKSGDKIKLCLPYTEKYRDREKITIAIGPDSISISTKAITGISARNILRGKIKTITKFFENPYRVVVDCGIEITAVITQLAQDELKLEEGKEVYMIFKTSSVRYLD